MTLHCFICANDVDIFIACGVCQQDICVDCSGRVTNCPFCRSPFPENEEPAQDDAVENEEEDINLMIHQVVDQINPGWIGENIPPLEPPQFVRDYFGGFPNNQPGYSDVEWFLDALEPAITEEVPWWVVGDLIGMPVSVASRVGRQVWARKTLFNAEGQNGGATMENIKIVLFNNGRVERVWNFTRLAYE